jgi:HK97 family phage portal protein
MNVRDVLRAALPETRAWQPQQPPYVTRSAGRAGADVTYDSAQAHAAVYACIDLICRIVVWQMPVIVHGRNGAPVDPPPIVANPHPQPHMLAEHWRASAQESVLLRGFAAGLVTETAGPGAMPARVMPLHPDEVRVSKERGRVVWRVGQKPAELWQTGGDLWVACAPRVAAGSVIGASPISYAASTIALGVHAAKFGADYFRAGGSPVAHGKVLDVKNIAEAQADALKARILQVVQNREPLITGNNFELTPLSVKAEESQFLETIRANFATVCSFFGISPESVGGSSGNSMTYANVEGLNLSLLTNTAGAWMRWWELTLGQFLPAGFRVELDPEALLRTSVPTLYDTAQKGVGRGGTPGVLTPNEARDLIGYGPHPDGGELYVPTSYTTSQQLADIAGGAQ